MGRNIKRNKIIQILIEKFLRSSECQKILKAARIITITSDANDELVLAGE